MAAETQEETDPKMSPEIATATKTTEEVDRWRLYKEILPVVGYSTFASRLLCISLLPGAIYIYIYVCVYLCNLRFAWLPNIRS